MVLRYLQPKELYFNKPVVSDMQLSASKHRKICRHGIFHINGNFYSSEHVAITSALK